MSLSDRERLELDDLCNAAVDETLTDTQRARLQDMLVGSPEARGAYVRAMALSASLYDCAGGMQAEAPEGLPIAPLPFRRRTLFWTLAAAAASVIAAVGFWLGGKPGQLPAAAPEDAEAVAHVSGTRDCRWVGAGLPAGADLQPGQHVEIAGGFLEITFDSGAQLVLEGPASVEVKSAWEADLIRGSIKARVPPEAIGFRVSNPQVDIVDLGTEFSMVANSDGSTEVFVLKGRVEARPGGPQDPRRPRVFLAERQARRFGAGAISDVGDSDRRFKHFLQDVAMDASLPPARCVRWSFDDIAGSRVPATLVGLKGSYDLKLEGLTPGGTEAALAGLWQKALPCDGRLSATGALPEWAQRPPFTVAFWLKVPEGAALSDPGAAVAWHGADGAMPLFGVAWNDTPAHGVVGALRTRAGRSVVTGATPLRDGRWHHVAVVVKRSAHAPQKLQIRQYVDGRLENVSARHGAKRDELARAEQGGAKADAALWVGRLPPDAGGDEGMFRGMLDELLLADRALTPMEIRRVMRENRLHASETLAAAGD